MSLKCKILTYLDLMQSYFKIKIYNSKRYIYEVNGDNGGVCENHLPKITRTYRILGLKNLMVSREIFQDMIHKF